MTKSVTSIPKGETSERTLVAAIQPLTVSGVSSGPVLKLERDSEGQYWLYSRRLTPAKALRWIASKHFAGGPSDAQWDCGEGMNALLNDCANLIEKGGAR